MVFIYYIQPTGGPLLYGKKLTFQLEMLGLIDTLPGLRMSPGQRGSCLWAYIPAYSSQSA